MKKVIKQWLAFTLAIGAFVSCGEDRNEPSSTAEGGGETVTLSLSAEVSVDDSDLRAINYKLGTNAKGQLVPLPEFRDGQEVDVHTILKSSRTGSVPVAKTLKWRYNSGSKKLVLRPEDGHSITVSGFNNDGGVKWYISGLIGGTLSGTKVTFAGTRELQGATSAGDAVGSLNVPYAFPWTEVVIDTSNSANTRDGNGSYKYAQVPSTANLKFAPQGSLIAYKLGNKQKAGAYTFTPSGFTVNTNAFGDKGTFELNTALPSNSTPTVLPTWTEGTPSALVYSFASGQEPGTIAHQQTADKVYYAWVMPHATQPANVVTRVTMKGDSSRPTTSTYRDYTKTWFTDYQVKASRLTSGRVHTLKANATHTYLLPIEYVTDYNLAGGEGLTTVVAPGTQYGYELNGPTLGGVQPIGVTGPLRFANYSADGTENDHGHRNDMSGYYNWYKVVGRHHATFNPQTKNLQTEVDATFGADKYYVPTIDQWWGIWPLNFKVSWTGSQSLDRDEAMAFGPGGDDLIRQSYRSDWSRGISANNSAQDAYIYAIRFKSRPVAQAMTVSWNYDASTNTNKSYTYPSAPDNSLKCAYRYRRVGGYTAWDNNISHTNANLTNQLVIDVVYLGEEAVPTTLAQISDNAWWDTKATEGLVISKTFPAAGYIDSRISVTGPISSSFGWLFNRASFAYYWSSNQSNALVMWLVGGHRSDFQSNAGYRPDSNLPVRLFARRNH